MHDHFADSVLSGEELLEEIPRAEEGKGSSATRRCSTTRSPTRWSTSRRPTRTGTTLAMRPTRRGTRTIWLLYAAAADKTKNVRFGTNLSSVYLREPTLICQALATSTS